MEALTAAGLIRPIPDGDVGTLLSTRPTSAQSQTIHRAVAARLPDRFPLGQTRSASRRELLFGGCRTMREILRLPQLFRSARVATAARVVL